MHYSFRDLHAKNYLYGAAHERHIFRVPKDLAFAAWLVSLSLFSAVVASIVLHMDKVVPGRGVLESPWGIFVVRNMQSGYVKEIHVRTGDVVKKDQVLVAFDQQQADLDLTGAFTDKELAARKIWADAKTVLPQLELRDRSELLNRISHVRNLNAMHGFTERLERQSSTVSEVFDVNRQSVQARLTDQLNQHALVLQSIDLLQTEVSRAEQLVKAEFESQNSLLAKRRALVDMQAREKSLLAEIQALRGESARLEKEKDRQMSDMVLEQLRRIDVSLGDYERATIKISQINTIKGRLTVRAPFDGTVDQLNLKGVGEFLAENTALVSLREGTPQDDLEIDILLPGSLAVWVKPGMKFRASAAGNNPEDHGHVMGEITFISQSTQQVKDVLSYRLKGRIEEFNLKQGIARDTFLRPGMDLRVEVITGTRSVMSYILDPFEKTLREAMSEPN